MPLTISQSPLLYSQQWDHFQAQRGFWRLGVESRQLDISDGPRPLGREGPGGSYGWVSSGRVRPLVRESPLQELTVGGRPSDGELIHLGILVLPSLYF